MNQRRNLWTREESFLVINLYTKLRFGQLHQRNPDVIELASLIGRTPGAVAYKLTNFASFDPVLKKRGIKGSVNAGPTAEKYWNEFNERWDESIMESERLLAKKKNTTVEQLNNVNISDIQKEGKDVERVVKARVNQSLFRKIILATYNNTCCITGINNPDLIIASHIKPWKDDTKNRTNPQNGLALNALHDKAFDKGLITITPDYKILVAQELLTDNKGLAYHFKKYNNKKIIKPHKFLPDKTFLEYHNDTIFRK